MNSSKVSKFDEQNYWFLSSCLSITRWNFPPFKCSGIKVIFFNIARVILIFWDQLVKTLQILRCATLDCVFEIPILQGFSYVVVVFLASLDFYQRHFMFSSCRHQFGNSCVILRYTTCGECFGTWRCYKYHLSIIHAILL